ncbi:MAG: cation:dicarboxylase symporter family transporter [Deltaproteobacteria bacterium]|nr:cation:dicarboxylase symporter family transporter [Deltaproteobacteria bacterium]
MAGRLFRLSLSAWIFVGLGLGVVFGLFFGELCRPLKFVGTAFLKLLQMGVLPYMVVTLIHGIGSLSSVEAKLMAGKGSIVLGSFWVVGLIVIFAFSFAFPVVPSSSFFSVSETPAMEATNLLDYYIPANIFDALSDALVPAIVVFSVFLGVALLSIENKGPFMNMLSVLARALSHMTKMVIKVAPIGVFALTATAVGTFSVEQLQRLQVYFVCYILASLVLTFWILPMIVTCFTSFTFRDILNYSKEALVLGFATGNNFVVLAVIADKSKELFAKVIPKEEKTGNMIDSVLPLAYSFPSVGKLIEILFIVFVAWYVNRTFSIGEYFELALSGVMSLFGSPKVGIPFLLDYMKLPGVYFDLYIMADVVTRKFKVLLQTMSMQALTIIITFLLLHKAIFNARRLTLVLAGTVLLVTLLIVVARFGLNYLVHDTYHEDAVLLGMEITDQSPAKILVHPPDLTGAFPAPIGTEHDLLKQIKDKGILRVGYNAEALPFAFFNSKNDLVGYDIYFAHRLARDMGVSLEFIPVQRGKLQEYLDAGICDIVMSAIPIRVDDLGKINFTRPYMEMKSALIVKDYRKKEFQTRADIAAITGLRVAVTQANSTEDLRLLRSYLPNVELVELHSIKDFFLRADIADALLTTDKIGKAWALLYPEFGVAVPKPYLFVYDVAYPIPIAKGDYTLLEYLNHWLTLQQSTGAVTQQFDYWILGKTPYRKMPRWSVIRNVLHWVD